MHGNQPGGKSPLRELVIANSYPPACGWGFHCEVESEGSVRVNSRRSSMANLCREMIPTHKTTGRTECYVGGRTGINPDCNLIHTYTFDPIIP